MKQKYGTWTVLAGAILITALFHRQPAGLNLWIAETLFFLWMFLTHQVPLKNRNVLITFSGVVLTAVSTVVTYSAFAYIMHAISVVLLTGMLASPGTRSLVNAAATGLLNLWTAQVALLRSLTRFRIGNRNAGAAIWRGRVFILPLVIVMIFLFLYRRSNPVFDDLVAESFSWLNNLMRFVFEDLNLALLGTFLLALAISSYILLRSSDQKVEKADHDADDLLQRKKGTWKLGSNRLGLKNEFRAAVFLLLVLNLLILTLNIVDVNWVWFNFEWEGQYLKQFVHEGTYLLILSILISAGLVLWYFRGNLNFYSRNGLLKSLSYIWLMQNVILAISVAIRNFYYISYFSLAYKRIGVIIFLILTLIGLGTVLMKVLKRKSGFYLFRTNALAWFITLALSATIPWDIIIARYNFRHADSAFLHLDYLSTLSDKALPYLQKPLGELKATDVVQKQKFPFDGQARYMPPEKYHQVIEDRIVSFKGRWESKGLLSWNLPEYIAYHQLKN